MTEQVKETQVNECTEESEVCVTSYFKAENGQIMKRVVEKSYTEETHFGTEYQYERIELADKVIYEWYKFDFSQDKYVVDASNKTPIQVDGVIYEPLNGRVEIL